MALSKASSPTCRLAYDLELGFEWPEPKHSPYLDPTHFTSLAPEQCRNADSRPLWVSPALGLLPNVYFSTLSLDTPSFLSPPHFTYFPNFYWSFPLRALMIYFSFSYLIYLLFLFRAERRSSSSWWLESSRVNSVVWKHPLRLLTLKGLWLGLPRLSHLQWGLLLSAG